MKLSDFFRIFKDNNEEIIKVLKMANELAAVNASSVDSNLSVIFESAGLFQKMEYWAKETARLKTRVNVLIDYKDVIKSQLRESQIKEKILQIKYDDLLESKKMLRIAFKNVNDENDRLKIKLKEKIND